ncbi:hypothetical protein FP2506_06286 [Fulvimarina pelagi HTCC2506]|uniref:Methyltransferase domain-containing protein n=1 Tax=Fulvimarina pelagi HTCC2506 TaxID=314231 RepID=Q0G7D9_9HYPH|nr:class I SAM-dependent methyltransferase [Fulvimarina pelagi]EAU42425.1 hypothetical protein FP2506_06286 [Fulvimarina pelagi HTCC2506]
MSGFEADWLTLREPADRRARNPILLEAAAAYALEKIGPIVDLGCGTGSTFRALDPLTANGRSWIFVDDDPRLLDRALEALPATANERVTLQRADLAQPTETLFAGAALVTASALFDLVSSAYIVELAQALRRENVGLYTALTVDGRVEWEKPHALDEIIVEAFARDQKTDKGFGEGLGGDAAAVLDDAFRAEGFSIRSSTSDWLLGADDAELQDAFHKGFAQTARARLDAEDLEEWLAFRASAAREGAMVRVGHRDCLAFPPG